MESVVQQTSCNDSANKFQNLILDPQLINIHLDGLSQILGHRGGLQSVERMPVLRVMIYWYVLDLPVRAPCSDACPGSTSMEATSKMASRDIHSHFNSSLPTANSTFPPPRLIDCHLMRFFGKIQPCRASATAYDKSTKLSPQNCRHGIYGAMFSSPDFTFHQSYTTCSPCPAVPSMRMCTYVAENASDWPRSCT